MLIPEKYIPYKDLLTTITWGDVVMASRMPLQEAYELTNQELRKRRNERSGFLEIVERSAWVRIQFIYPAAITDTLFRRTIWEQVWTPIASLEDLENAKLYQFLNFDEDTFRTIKGL